MRKKKVGAIAIKSFALLVVLGTAHQAMAQDATTPYPSMAPIEQYLMDRTAEIALARSAAPESISGMQRSWFLDVMVSKQRSKEKTVSCVAWNAPGLPHRILTFGIRKCGCRNV